MELKKIKDWGNKHWKKIAIGAAVVGGGVAAYCVGHKHGHAIIEAIQSTGLKNISEPTFGKFTKFEVSEALKPFVNEVSSNHPDEYLDIWYKDIPFDDLGNFGEALKTTFPNSNRILGCAATITNDIVEATEG